MKSGMKRTRVAVFIDLANMNGAFERLHAQQKLLSSVRMDYSRLVDTLTLGSEVVAKTIYVETRDTADQTGQRNFSDFFKRKNFTVVSKPIKVIKREDGESLNKANFDVEIATDVSRRVWRRDCSEIILFSGDSDFAYLLDMVKELDIKVTIVSTLASISKELKERANKLILLDELTVEDYTFIKKEKR